MTSHPPGRDCQDVACCFIILDGERYPLSAVWGPDDTLPGAL